MKAIRKENLPVKICIVCNRPFSWRKKWEKVWEDVKYCSDKCRKKKSNSQETKTYFNLIVVVDCFEFVFRELNLKLQ